VVIPIADAGTISSIVVGVTVSHTWVGDLIYRLTSPSGTTIRLMDRPDRSDFPPSGLGDNSNLSVELVFDDAATALAETIGAGCNNLETVGVDAGCTNVTFKPEQALSAFAGQNLNGTWTLNVSDNQADDVGTISAWRMTVTTAAVSQPATLVLFGAGLAGLVALRRRRAG
jgi:subtilisin-like proprotein convertase family protein